MKTAGTVVLALGALMATAAVMGLLVPMLAEVSVNDTWQLYGLMIWSGCGAALLIPVGFLMWSLGRRRDPGA